MELYTKVGMVCCVIYFLLHNNLHAQKTSQEISKKEELIELQLFKRNLEVIKQSTPDEEYLQDVVLKVSNDIISINSKTQLLKEDSLKDLSVYELNYLETKHKNILKDVEKYKKEATELKTQMTLYKESLDTLYKEIQGIKIDSLISFLQIGNMDSVLGRDEAVFVEQFKSTKYEVEFARTEVNKILKKK